MHWPIWTTNTASRVYAHTPIKRVNASNFHPKSKLHQLKLRAVQVLLFRTHFDCKLKCAHRHTYTLTCSLSQPDGCDPFVTSNNASRTIANNWVIFNVLKMFHRISFVFHYSYTFAAMNLCWKKTTSAKRIGAEREREGASKRALGEERRKAETPTF